MFISKLLIKNFRSINQALIRFEKGKNVIVGKNNSGKSNIIKALEIIIGERFPTYINFTDNDFYTTEAIEESSGKVKESIEENLYIEVEITGNDFDEEMIKSIKKKTAFSKIVSHKALYTMQEDGELQINFDFFQNLDNIAERDEIETLGTTYNDRPIKNRWLSSEELYNELIQVKRFKIFFCKSRIDEDASGFGVIYQNQNNDLWISNFMSKKLRNSLITTTVISALRSPKEDLRLVHYSWFGKLISSLWNQNKSKVDENSKRPYDELIKEQTVEIKALVDKVFEDNTLEIRKLLEKAISHKSVSFKFLNDSKFDLYKNIQIFVNDGIDRPLAEKGTGIQSAIIIALFSQYCNKFHNKSSLLVVEEPELYLHPQARRVISAELNTYINHKKSQERQLIINTHSTEYLKNVSPFNIIRVYKDENENCSLVSQLDKETNENITQEIQRFIWSNNTELFFADKAILVEGGELYILPALVDRYKETKQFLDYENISVVRVNGKGNFITYIKMLDKFNIKWFILGDLDCFKDEVGKICKYLDRDDLAQAASEVKKALNSKNTDYNSIYKRVKNIKSNFDAQNLMDLFAKFEKGEISKDEPLLTAALEHMKERYAKINSREAIENNIEASLFDSIQSELRKSNIFIWSHGELEDYLTEESMNIKKGKDLRALELSYLIEEPSSQLEKYFSNLEEVNELCEWIINKKPRTMAKTASDAKRATSV